MLCRSLAELVHLTRTIESVTQCKQTVFWAVSLFELHGTYLIIGHIYLLNHTGESGIGAANTVKVSGRDMDRALAQCIRKASGLEIHGCGMILGAWLPWMPCLTGTGNTDFLRVNAFNVGYLSLRMGSGRLAESIQSESYNLLIHLMNFLPAKTLRRN